MAALGGVPMRLRLKLGDAEGAELSVRSGKWDVFTSRLDCLTKLFAVIRKGCCRRI